MKMLTVLLKEPQCDSGWYWYLKQVCTEELFFRLILCWAFAQILSDWVAVICSTLIFALSHFILFRWQMVVASGILGLFLGKLFLVIAGKETRIEVVVALIMVIIIHYLLGVLCTLVGLTNKWLKNR